MDTFAEQSTFVDCVCKLVIWILVMNVTKYISNVLLFNNEVFVKKKNEIPERPPVYRK